MISLKFGAVGTAGTFGRFVNIAVAGNGENIVIKLLFLKRLDIIVQLTIGVHGKVFDPSDDFLGSDVDMLLSLPIYHYQYKYLKWPKHRKSSAG